MTGQRIRIAVIDSGIGIKHEDFSKLFKVFGKITQTDEANPQGIGLGLTVCNRILSQFPARAGNNTSSCLQVKSRYGEGSEFYFYMYMPVAPALDGTSDMRGGDYTQKSNTLTQNPLNDHSILTHD